MSPLVHASRLAALVPRPRLHRMSEFFTRFQPEQIDNKTGFMP
jgi:hypothetical protein